MEMSEALDEHKHGIISEHELHKQGNKASRHREKSREQIAEADFGDFGSE